MNHKLLKNVYFISGIDTDVGKTFATGYLAKNYLLNNINTITLKFIQTGFTKNNNDVLMHRKIMNINKNKDDKNKLTLPLTLKYPASPYFSSLLENKKINLNQILTKIIKLKEKYEIVLIEGIGGLMVPITSNYLIIDFIKDYKLQLILVISGKVGSINHTLLSIEAIIKRKIKLDTIVYNLYPKIDSKLKNFTINYIKDYLKKNSSKTQFIEMPILNIP